MEKKKKWKNKRTSEGWKAHYWLFISKTGFWEELGEQTRVSAGNPFLHSDSAVKPSALAVRLEKPSRLFICRYCYCDFEEGHRRLITIFSWESEGVFPLARVGEWTLELGVLSFSKQLVVGKLFSIDCWCMRACYLTYTNSGLGVISWAACWSCWPCLPFSIEACYLCFAWGTKEQQYCWFDLCWVCIPPLRGI